MAQNHQLPIHPDPIDTAHLFPEVLEHLLALLAALSDEEWRMPTVCPGWSVNDVALHLLGVEIGNLSSRRDGFSDPSWKSLDAGPIKALNRWNEAWVQASRRISPALLLQLLEVTGRGMARYVAGLDLEA